jgi:hypothetical protein
MRELWRPSRDHNLTVGHESAGVGSRGYRLYAFNLPHIRNISVPRLPGLIVVRLSSRRSRMDKNRRLIQLSESERTDFGRVNFEQQRPEQRVFSTVWALESQINNGGFAQYFISHDGETAYAAPWALREIGAVHCAEIVTRALKIATPSVVMPLTQEEREGLIDTLSPLGHAQLEALDAEFLAYPDNLTELLYTYVSERPFVFGRSEA